MIHSVHTRREEEFCDRLSSRATFNGFTALHYAVLNDNLPLINLLIEYGADLLIENEQGHLPSAYALQQRKELLSQLEKNVSSMLELFFPENSHLLIFRRRNYMKKDLKLKDDDDH